jgi:alanyl-tRNA synthetase
MGLERISAVLSGKTSNYATELFTPILRALGKMAGREYRDTMEPGDVSMRVVADHIRATTFLIGDGVVPSNEMRGYVLRKIMRRAMRHGRKIGLDQPFLHALVDVVVAEMGEAYPEIKNGRDSIVRVVHNEEEKFSEVLTGGLPRLEDLLDQAAKSDRIVPGAQAFKLYDTYGLPRDFIEDLASNQGLTFDTAGFEAAMQGQRDKARASSAFDGGRAEEFTFGSDADRSTLASRTDSFEGYTTTTVSGASVVALFDDRKAPVDRLANGASGYAVLD